MTTSFASRVQVLLGCALGVLLQPLTVWIVFHYFSGKEPAGGWGLGIFAWVALYLGLLPVEHLFVVPSFGVAQALTILPTALLLSLTRNYEVVRGLLYVGTALALANVGVLVYVSVFRIL